MVFIDSNSSYKGSVDDFFKAYAKNTASVQSNE